LKYFPHKEVRKKITAFIPSNVICAKLIVSSNNNLPPSNAYANAK
jgi:hypothetical protein